MNWDTLSLICQHCNDTIQFHYNSIVSNTCSHISTGRQHLWFRVQSVVNVFIVYLLCCLKYSVMIKCIIWKSNHNPQVSLCPTMPLTILLLIEWVVCLMAYVEFTYSGLIWPTYLYPYCNFDFEASLWYHPRVYHNMSLEAIVFHGFIVTGIW